MKIKIIHAREILDSRGIPTIETSVFLEDGSFGVASVPSGASTGEHEAWEFRDGDIERFHGKGVLKAVHNVETKIAEALVGTDATNQKLIDQKMLDLDGTENKKSLGANAILSVSLATAKAAANSLKLPLYKYLHELYSLDGHWQEGLGVEEEQFQMPRIMSVVIEAGKHSASNIEVQEFMIVPEAERYCDALEETADIYHELAEVLSGEKKSINVGLEGAYGPEVSSNHEPIEYILEAINKLKIKNEKFQPKADPPRAEKIKEVGIALDVAASEFFQNGDGGRYSLNSEGVGLSTNQMIGLLSEWVEKYPMVSIEDGLSEDDFAGWKELTARLGKKILIVGDDITVTNSVRLKECIEKQAANALIIKPNQIGTLMETFKTIHLAKENGYKTIISHRSGETNETFIADLSVAVSSDFIKTGAPSRGERLAKYNRLLEIEQEITKDSPL
ncbi:phosphopyruvate hydratase [bacterium (Candidatus Howlettbacteria) CG_4_10_14_0_8_um_filter_40_9]|nr:MAG: phosphopyruvate hydratase [bacterium (Candidatus Howlettbacteria) CG_4_10_14_0_8_um_filter_40_9]